MSTCLDVVPPYNWLTDLTFIASNNPDSVLMTLLNIVVNDTRLVVVDLNPHRVELHLVTLYISIHIKVRGYRRTSTECYSILDDVWFGRPALYVNTIGLTR